MSTDVVNMYHFFDVGEHQYKVKSLGLAEMLAQSGNIIHENLRKALKKDALEFFPGENEATQRVDYIIKTQKEWPAGDELEAEATNFMLTGSGMDALNIYALGRFNKALRGGDKAAKVYEEMQLDDQYEMVRVVMGSFSETMGMYLDELASVVQGANEDSEEETDSEGDEKKPEAETP